MKIFLILLFGFISLFAKAPVFYGCVYDTKEETINDLNNVEKRLNDWISHFNNLSPAELQNQEFLADLPNNFPSIIQDFSEIIPVFLFIDEIQVLQTISFTNKKKKMKPFFIFALQNLQIY